MKLLRLPLFCVLFYATLLAVFGDNNQHAANPQPTTKPTIATVVYSPITAPPTTNRTTVAVTTTSVEPSSTTAPSTSVVPLVGPDTPCQEWIPLAVKQGWPADRDILETLASVMWRESRCLPGAINSNSPDHGLTQINEIHRAYVEQIYGIPFEQAMTDPAKNLHFAYRLYSELEAAGRCGWAPWSLTCR